MVHHLASLLRVKEATEVGGFVPLLFPLPLVTLHRIVHLFVCMCVCVLLFLLLCVFLPCRREKSKRILYERKEKKR